MVLRHEGEIHFQRLEPLANVHFREGHRGRSLWWLRITYLACGQARSKNGTDLGLGSQEVLPK